ncbi:MAG: M23 family metallopeptidase [Balneolales bacterium]|nr:M23 family metallopeptidase [Balneolales bacterium]
MFEFIKKLLSVSKENLTVLLWKGSTHDETETYIIDPKRMLGIVIISHAVVVFIVFLFFYLTPLGTFLFNKDDQAIRNQILEVRDQVEVLRDSLIASEVQIANFKMALAAGIDTTFETRSTGFTPPAAVADPVQTQLPTSFSEMREPVRGLYSDEIIFSNTFFFSSILEFPVEFPLSGSVSRIFEPETGHFGIDIAAPTGTVIPAFAEGVIIFSGFTINYGNVVVLQHSDGYTSIYKHCENLTKEKGDFVSRGDIIGTVAGSGLISSGPHLHYELWHHGLPLDPSIYFSNFN